MKNFKFLMLFFIAFIAFGCPEEINPISGDSYLKIINDTDYSVKIYFDNSYIGRVGSDKDDSWSVPSGSHVIKATCSFSEDYEATHNFYSGNITEITLKTVNKYGKVLLNNINSEKSDSGFKLKNDEYREKEKEHSNN